MSEQPLQDTSRQVVRDSDGRFVKGCSGNPKGSNQYNSIVPLIEALEKAGTKQNEKFWDMVARKAFCDERVLIAVLKKLIPDNLKLEGEGFAKDRTLILQFGQLYTKPEVPIGDAPSPTEHPASV
jgi:hypothetical protein